MTGASRFYCVNNSYLIIIYSKRYLITTRCIGENKGLLLRVDIRKAPNQYGFRTEQINELLDGNIIQGSGKNYDNI